MDLSTLKPAEGAISKRKRIGRGEGSKKGGTSTRGHKGAQSRSGYSRKRGFEGGQMPLYKRIPKFGFKNRNRVEYNVLNLDTLSELIEKFKVTKIDFDFMMKHGLVSKKDKVKILARGEFDKEIEIHAHAFSAKAKEAIEKSKGKACLID